ncbi:MAG: alanine--tRNA ligase-related protein [Candidatus Odinarchaeota archaeon]
MTEKLYWDNAYRTKFTAKVKLIYEEGVILDKTLFYPESGNQASDVGNLKIKDEKFNVIKVTKDKNYIIHHISSEFKSKINIGDVVEGKIDWDNRNGIMKAHSSQHIFSAIIKNKYNIETNRAIINYEDVFLQISQEIDYDQLSEILTEVNKIYTTNNLKVNATIISYKEAEEISKKIRSVIANESQVRLIEIEGLDLVCCGGTHVKNSTEIGPIFIYDFKKGTDIRYVIGNKALEMYFKTNSDLIELANEINTPLNKFKELLKKRLKFFENLQEKHKELSYKLLSSISKAAVKKIDDISLFYIDFDIDIKILNKSLDNFPSNSLIIVQFEDNKIRILSPNEKIDSNKIMQELIRKFSGKGGGNSKSAQGFLKKMPENLLSEIELLLN